MPGTGPRPKRPSGSRHTDSSIALKESTTRQCGPVLGSGTGAGLEETIDLARADRSGCLARGHGQPGGLPAARLCKDRNRMSAQADIPAQAGQNQRVRLIFGALLLVLLLASLDQ